MIDGVQQIRTHATLLTNGELIPYPYGYTKADVPADMAYNDLRAFVTMAQAMAASNGYGAMQSSDLYVTDGDQIDWMYARGRIFSFTFERYPTEQVSSHADHEPPDEVIEAQTSRSGGAPPLFHRPGRLPVRGGWAGRSVLLGPGVVGESAVERRACRRIERLDTRLACQLAPPAPRSRDTTAD